MPRTKATEPIESAPADRPSPRYPVGARVRVLDRYADGPIDCNATIITHTPNGGLRIKLDDGGKLITVTARSLSKLTDDGKSTGPVRNRNRLK